MLLLRVLFIALIAVSPLVAEDAAPIPTWDQFVSVLQKWGPEKNGLQLRAESDSQCGIIRCWVRNASNKQLDYKPHVLGYFSCVNVLVLQGPVWIELKRKHINNHPVYGTGYRMDDALPAAPLQILESKHYFECLDERSSWIPMGEFLMSEPRKDLPILESRGATFFIDLAEFEWPESLLSQKTLALSVTQLTDFRVNALWLEAPEFELDTAAFRTFLASLAIPPAPKK